ncbi:N-acetylglucosamine-binding protein GbpA [Shewanella algae]|uniref:N-acetylglucosamine-binding protein GbpA n=1 Tax=Shewanella algae TaxID=38313 RepID=UPI001AAF2E3B|nr:N-acetylglucosamine-binding protein GbpA [Shewanella algae]MBO2634160.1 N-acetylglucosamine-binding protein GbpA [Shewanella algae]
MEYCKVVKSSFKTTALSLALAAAGVGLSTQALAHGYVKSPESRAYACNQHNNTSCGAIQWEPQSVEGPSGFPASGPADGQIASAGNASFRELDQQSSSRWTKQPVSAGPINFTWQLTANHVTRDWRYYLTKQNWDPNAPLSRAAFESEPFCSVDGGMVQPPKTLTHQCQLPQRSGYQLVLAVWEVGDTSNSFYNVIDVNFDGAAPTPSEWQDVGNINPSQDLKAGDQVFTRVFGDNGEQPSLSTRLTIADAGQGNHDTWPSLLAEAINAGGTGLKAGQLNANGEIVPVYGKNDVFAQNDSGITRVETGFELAPLPGGDFSVSGLSDNYEIVDGKASVGFTVTTDARMQVSAFISTHDGKASGSAVQQIDNNSADFNIEVLEPAAGHYHMQLKAQTQEGKELTQEFGFFLRQAGDTAPADFQFPDGLGSYTEGTRVLQPKDGKIYRCKPFPESGYCRQWSASATQFEPGVGSHWQLAWIAE